MTTVAARPPRPIPTVQASPALLREGDMIYPDPDIDYPYLQPRKRPLRVLRPAERVELIGGGQGWRIDMEFEHTAWVPNDAKVRTQRRPNPQQLIGQDVADRLAENYQEPRYG